MQSLIVRLQVLKWTTHGSVYTTLHKNVQIETRNFTNLEI